MPSIPNDEWTLIGDATPDNLQVQNVGTTRVAYVFAASLPASDAIELESEEHFIMLPYQPALNLNNLSTGGVSMYARSLGPINALVAVSSYVAA